MIIREEKLGRAKYFLRPEKKLVVKVVDREFFPITYDELETELKLKIKEIKSQWREFHKTNTGKQSILMFGKAFYYDWAWECQRLISRIKKPFIEEADGDVSKAKLFPIQDLIQFRQGFAPCIWHDDSSPSMKLYKKTNTVYCFGCNHSGDPIDVVMKLWEVEFKEAVGLLNSKKLYNL